MDCRIFLLLCRALAKDLRDYILTKRRKISLTGHMITGDECGPNSLTFVLRLREDPGKNLNQETDPKYRIRAHCGRHSDN